MNDRIEVHPEVLRRAAAGHAEAAEYLRTVPESNEAFMATLESLGPVYAELREEGRLKLDQRRRSYEGLAAAHEIFSADLHAVNGMWADHEEHAAGQFRGLTAL